MIVDMLNLAAIATVVTSVVGGALAFLASSDD